MGDPGIMHVLSAASRGVAVSHVRCRTTRATCSFYAHSSSPRGCASPRSRPVAAGRNQPSRRPTILVKREQIAVARTLVPRSTSRTPRQASHHPRRPSIRQRPDRPQRRRRFPLPRSDRWHPVPRRARRQRPHQGLIPVWPRCLVRLLARPSDRPPRRQRPLWRLRQRLLQPLPLRETRRQPLSAGRRREPRPRAICVVWLPRPTNGGCRERISPESSVLTTSPSARAIAG